MGKLAFISATVMAMSFANAAAAADIKLLGSPGVRGLVEALAPKFQARTGHTIAGDFEVIAKIKKRIDGGERFDIAVLSPEALAALIADKKADGQAPFARAGMGVGFRKGAARPDVSSADALRKTLLAARSVVYSAQGLSGKAYLALVERLGIAAEMKDKAKADDGNILEPVAAGAVELVVTSMSTIALNKGVELAGPFPAELQQYVVFNAGVASQAAQKDAAGQFLDFLKSAEAAPLFAAAGLER
ncbi:MAG: substrate-binding domain-containing protein [Xanthobacteraceae bacterium]